MSLHWGPAGRVALRSSGAGGVPGQRTAVDGDDGPGADVTGAPHTHASPNTGEPTGATLSRGHSAVSYGYSADIPELVRIRDCP